MQKDLVLIVITLSAIGVSLAIDKPRTRTGIKRGAKMLKKLLPQFMLLLALVSIFLGFLSMETIMNLLGREAGKMAVFFAALIGSLALIPGPIVYPLAGILRQSGVSYAVLATFITTLMMVGILTFPVEKEYLGARMAVIRNVLCFLGALLISIFAGGLL